VKKVLLLIATVALSVGLMAGPASADGDIHQVIYENQSAGICGTLYTYTYLDYPMWGSQVVFGGSYLDMWNCNIFAPAAVWFPPGWLTTNLEIWRSDTGTSYMNICQYADWSNGYGWDHGLLTSVVCANPAGAQWYAARARACISFDGYALWACNSVRYFSNAVSW